MRSITEYKLEGNNAVFSDCGDYRYALWRIWNPPKGIVMFIGLNPSKADARVDDPTIRRVTSFAYHWGYGGVAMLNLYPFITAFPSELERTGNLAFNDEWLTAVGNKADKIVFAWGAFDVFGRDEKVKEMFKTRYALVVNKDGSPRHPLYVALKTEPIIF